MHKIIVLVVATFMTGMVMAASQIDKYKAVFDTFPQHVPDRLIPDAPVVGNGDLGITVGTSKDTIRFYIGKNDFWRSIPSYPTGALALPGGLDLRCGLMTGAKYHAEQLPGSAKVNVEYTSDQGKLNIGTWVAATDNKLVIELCSTVDTILELNLWAQQGGYSTTASGPNWVTRSFVGVDHLLWPCHVAMAMNVPSGKVSLKSNQVKRIVVAIYSSFDTDTWKEKAIKEATTDGLDNLRAKHDAWWENFWGLSHVSFDDPMLEKYYYLSQYIFACSSRNGKVAPGLFGPFITTDIPLWAGDFHLNYNYQAPYWDSYSSNHLCLVDNYDAPLLDAMEKGREYSRKIHGTGGILYPVGLGPFGLISSSWPLDTADMKHYGTTDNTIDCGAMFWQQVTNASFGAANMLMRFYSTYDKKYAEKVYPFILACGDFWEDYLTLKDGTYQVIPDIFYETSPLDNIGDNRNTVTSLGLVKMTMKGLLEMSAFLGIDENRRAKWQDIINRLHPYPVENDIPMTGIGKMSTPVYAEAFRILSHGVIIPAGVLERESKYNQLLLSQMAKWKENIPAGKDWFNSLGNGIESSYPAAVRCGWPAKDILFELKHRIDLQSYPNGWIMQRGGGIETLSVVPMTINEMMLQSFDGVIRIFPNWDRTLNASFETLRAYGAFLVSASITSGNISDISLKSEKGRDCIMENPWPGNQVLLYKNGKLLKKLSGDTLSFKTTEGSQYSIKLQKK